MHIMCMYIYIYTYKHISLLGRGGEAAVEAEVGVLLRDRKLYTTTNKSLQCLAKMMYTVL